VPADTTIRVYGFPDSQTYARLGPWSFLCRSRAMRSSKAIRPGGVRRQIFRQLLGLAPVPAKHLVRKHAKPLMWSPKFLEPLLIPKPRWAIEDPKHIIVVQFHVGAHAAPQHKALHLSRHGDRYLPESGRGVLAACQNTPAIGAESHGMDWPVVDKGWPQAFPSGCIPEPSAAIATPREDGPAIGAKCPGHHRAGMLEARAERFACRPPASSA
jgi:hypothetical protein